MSTFARFHEALEDAMHNAPDQLTRDAIREALYAWVHRDDLDRMTRMRDEALEAVAVLELRVADLEAQLRGARAQYALGDARAKYYADKALNRAKGDNR